MINILFSVVIEMKRTCKKCGVEKDIEEFVKVRLCRFGRSYRCKECESKIHGIYHNKNKERILEYRRQYYNKNKEQVSEYNRLYRAENKEQSSEHNRLYRAENKEQVSEYQRLYRAEKKELISEHHRNDTKNLSDSYVKQQITQRSNLKTSDVTQEMIELKREILQYKRLEKEINDVINSG